MSSNVLRTVSDENGFHFYSALDSPLGVKANNLEQFLKELSVVDPSSLRFHLSRQDFEKWILMLGDQTLAKQISALRAKKLTDSQLKTQLSRMVRLRLGKLRKT